MPAQVVREADDLSSSTLFDGEVAVLTLVSPVELVLMSFEVVAAVVEVVDVGFAVFCTVSVTVAALDVSSVSSVLSTVGGISVGNGASCSHGGWLSSIS